MNFENYKDILLPIAIIFIAIHAIISYISLFNTILARCKGNDETRIQRYFKRKNYSQLGKILIIYLEFMIVLMYLSLHFAGAVTSDNTDISTRIENISQDLSKNSAELLSIQQELEERVEFVENLKEEAEIAENVISLTEEQVNAIQTKLNQELEASSSKGLTQSILISTFFFVLGVVVQPIVSLIKTKFSKVTENNVAASNDQYSDEELKQALKLLETIRQKGED